MDEGSTPLQELKGRSYCHHWLVAWVQQGYISFATAMINCGCYPGMILHHPLISGDKSTRPH